MMNVFSWFFMTLFADTICFNKCFSTSFVPSEAVACWCTAFPARMISSVGKLRLPFTHATTTTKELVAVEVTNRASEGFTAPLTGMRFLVTTSGITSPYLALLSAIPRTIYLRSFACTGCRFTAYHANIFYWQAKASQLLTFVRTVALWPLGTSAVKRVKVLSAILTFRNSFTSHNNSIPQLEIEEKYCEISALKKSWS